MTATSTQPKLSAAEQAMVDEYVAVRARVRAWKADVNPDAARYAELHAWILSQAEGVPAEQPYVLEGVRHKVPVSAQENQSVISNLKKLVRKLGQKWFVENAKVTLAAVKKALPKDQIGNFITTTRTGPREIGEPSLKETAAK